MKLHLKPFGLPWYVYSDPVHQMTIDKSFSYFGTQHLACIQNHTHIVKKILDIPDIDVDQQDRLGKTPLHWAVKRGHRESVALLLQHSANINVMDYQGKFCSFPSPHPIFTSRFLPLLRFFGFVVSLLFPPPSIFLELKLPKIELHELLRAEGARPGNPTAVEYNVTYKWELLPPP